MRELRTLLDAEVAERGPVAVFDPFAGIGTVHELSSENVATFAIELQPEWAAAHPDTHCGNVLDIPKLCSGMEFDVLVTSPCYGNRMADSHDAQDKCRSCAGTGRVDAVECSACKGSGLTLRNTYTHALQRSGVDIVRDDNAAVMQWGPRYRQFHEQAWALCDSVLTPGALVLLNVKNHIRTLDGVQRVQRVVEFHLNVWLCMRYTIERAVPISTRGLAYGANSDVRTPVELILALRKPTR